MRTRVTPFRTPDRRILGIVSVSLGMPSTPAPTLAPRRPTRQLMVGAVGVGSEHPISVQSMTTTLTSDVNSTLQQIAELTAAGNPDNGPPGERPRHHPGYYAAYVLDPDGNNIEAVNHNRT